MSFAHELNRRTAQLGTDTSWSLPIESFVGATPAAAVPATVAAVGKGVAAGSAMVAAAWTGAQVGDAAD